MSFSKSKAVYGFLDSLPCFKRYERSEDSHYATIVMLNREVKYDPILKNISGATHLCIKLSITPGYKIAASAIYGVPESEYNPFNYGGIINRQGSSDVVTWLQHKRIGLEQILEIFPKESKKHILFNMDFFEEYPAKKPKPSHIKTPPFAGYIKPGVYC